MLLMMQDMSFLIRPTEMISEKSHDMKKLILFIIVAFFVSDVVAQEELMDSV